MNINKSTLSIHKDLYYSHSQIHNKPKPLLVSSLKFAVARLQ